MNTTDEHVPEFEERLFSISDVKEMFLIIGDDKILNFFNLSDRHKAILKMRWQNQYKMDDIADHFGLTRERVRQIYRVAVDKLKKRVSKAIDEFSGQMSFAEENRILKEENAVYKKRFESLSEHDKAMVGNVGLLRMNILEVEDFSVRAKNVFRDNDIETLNDLLEYTEKDLYKFRNMGKKTVEEILFFIEKNGLELKKPISFT